MSGMSTEASMTINQSLALLSPLSFVKQSDFDVLMTDGVHPSTAANTADKMKCKSASINNSMTQRRGELYQCTNAESFALLRSILIETRKHHCLR
jgi:hypothetical protein